jgi:hypothetical protein
VIDWKMQSKPMFGNAPQNKAVVLASELKSAAPAWDSPYRSASSRCTGAGYGSSRSQGEAPRLRSPYRLLLSNKST